MSNSKPLLTSEEIDALVEGVVTGEVDTSLIANDLEDAVVSYSLVAPDTISHNQLVALDLIHDRFTRQLRGSLLTLLRKTTKISILPYQATTFGEYIKTVPTPCNINIVRYPPLRGYGLATIEPTLIFGAVDSFFGGHGGGTHEMPQQRGFTPTEERIIQMLLDTIFIDLCEAWSPVYKLNVERMSQETNPAFAQVCDEKETVIVTAFEIDIGIGVRGKLTVMYPFSALKPIRLLLRGGLQSTEKDPKLAARWEKQMRSAVGAAEIEVVAELATMRVPALDLAMIRSGDTLWFSPPENVKILAQSTHLCDAEFGTANNNTAIRIQRMIPPPIVKGDDVDEERERTLSGNMPVGSSAKTAGVSPV